MISTNRILSKDSSSLVPFLAGTVLGMTASFALMSLRKRQRRHPVRPSDLPEFAQQLQSNKQLHRVRLREWEDLDWRDKNGWKGRDLCHNPEGKAVRVLQYYYNDETKKMTGIVWFGPHAESHRGLCHGGAMTSLMDDFCGHMAFLNSTQGPWSGATVQVNVALKKPVRVGSVLRIVGKISKQEGRKVYVEAVLDGGGSGSASDNEEQRPPRVYATLEGLSIDGVKMSDHDDSVAERTWEVDVCKKSGRLQRRDSGWKLN
jgi:acyl-coenzyme A thioesterase PaaI-like protein